MSTNYGYGTISNPWPDYTPKQLAMHGYTAGSGWRGTNMGTRENRFAYGGGPDPAAAAASSGSGVPGVVPSSALAGAASINQFGIDYLKSGIPNYDMNVAGTSGAVTNLLNPEFGRPAAMTRAAEAAVGGGVQGSPFSRVMGDQFALDQYRTNLQLANQLQTGQTSRLPNPTSPLNFLLTPNQQAQIQLEQQRIAASLRSGSGGGYGGGSGGSYGGAPSSGLSSTGSGISDQELNKIINSYFPSGPSSVTAPGPSYQSDGGTIYGLPDEYLGWDKKTQQQYEGMLDIASQDTGTYE